MARTMLREAEIAFLEDDRLKAPKAIARNLQVNRLHEESFETLAGMCEEGHEHSEAIAHLLTVSKALERISDHAKNVAQGVVFTVEGRDLRHRSLEDGEHIPSLNPPSPGETSPREA